MIAWSEDLRIESQERADALLNLLKWFKKHPSHMPPLRTHQAKTALSSLCGILPTTEKIVRFVLEAFGDSFTVDLLRKCMPDRDYGDAYTCAKSLVREYHHEEEEGDEGEVVEDEEEPLAFEVRLPCSFVVPAGDIFHVGRLQVIEFEIRTCPDARNWFSVVGGEWRAAGLVQENDAVCGGVLVWNVAQVPDPHALLSSLCAPVAGVQRSECGRHWDHGPVGVHVPGQTSLDFEADLKRIFDDDVRLITMRSRWASEALPWILQQSSDEFGDDGFPPGATAVANGAAVVANTGAETPYLLEWVRASDGLMVALSLTDSPPTVFQWSLAAP